MVKAQKRKVLSKPEHPEEAEGPIEMSVEECRAILMISPEGSSGEALKSLHPSAEITGIISAMQTCFLENDTHNAERLLMSQAMILNSIFTRFTSRMTNTTDLDTAEYFSKVALRAQNQCQRTLKTLLELKIPERATFIREQNNTLNQQFNAGVESDPREEKKINPANELLEINHHERLESGAPTEAIRGDKEVETVEEVNRSED